MMELRTNRLIIRDFLKTDFDFYKDLEQAPSTYQYESDQMSSIDELYNRFNDILDLQKNDNREKWSLIIIDNQILNPIGRIVLWEVDSSIREWEIGWYIKKAYQNHGYATEAAQKMLEFAFSKIKAHRIQALCHHSNRASEKVMEKQGMKKEGELREIRFMHQKWVNMSIYSLLESEFEGINNGN